MLFLTFFLSWLVHKVEADELPGLISDGGADFVEWSEAKLHNYVVQDDINVV